MTNSGPKRTRSRRTASRTAARAGEPRTRRLDPPGTDPSTTTPAAAPLSRARRHESPAVRIDQLRRHADQEVMRRTDLPEGLHGGDEVRAVRHVVPAGRRRDARRVQDEDIDIRGQLQDQPAHVMSGLIRLRGPGCHGQSAAGGCRGRPSRANRRTRAASPGFGAGSGRVIASRSRSRVVAPGAEIGSTVTGPSSRNPRPNRARPEVATASGSRPAPRPIAPVGKRPAEDPPLESPRSRPTYGQRKSINAEPIRDQPSAPIVPRPRSREVSGGSRNRSGLSTVR